MKLIQALKETKEIKRKIDELNKKIGGYCTDLDHETPTYPDQRSQVAAWLQAVSDHVKELARLRIAIQRTNLATKVSIKLGANYVEHTIAEWIHRRKDLAGIEEAAWKGLTDRGLKENLMMNRSDGTQVAVKVRRYFEPPVRDRNIDLFRSEPSTIDGTLETVNAVTDLIEA